MYCSSCGVQLEEHYSYCHACGRPTNPDRTSPWGVPKSLSRPLWARKIGGVCAGFARYFDVDVTIMRVIWLVVAIFTGVGFIAYRVAWIAMPAEHTLMRPVYTQYKPASDQGTPPPPVRPDEPEHPPAPDDSSFSAGDESSPWPQRS